LWLAKSWWFNDHMMKTKKRSGTNTKIDRRPKTKDPKPIFIVQSAAQPHGHLNTDNRLLATDKEQPQ
jgi:hypothetical protein